VFIQSLVEVESKKLRQDLKNIGGSMELRSKQLHSALGGMDWLQPAAEATINAFTSFTPPRAQA
jgi:hypothetical protein